MKSEVTYSRKLRTIYLRGEVLPSMAIQFRYYFSLLTLNAKDPVTVEIFSEGGDMDSGLAIADTIRASPVKVITFAAGVAMSSAALILAAGHHRKALVSGSIMVHQGAYKISGSFAELKKGDMLLVERMEKTFNEFFASLTKKPVGFWEELWKQNNVYLSPNEAMELGLIDEVVGWRSLESS